jgi:hypothetical protein
MIPVNETIVIQRLRQKYSEELRRHTNEGLTFRAFVEQRLDSELTPELVAFIQEQDELLDAERDEMNLAPISGQ